MAVNGKLSIILAFVLTGLSTVIVLLRFYSRHFLVGKLSASDWVMSLALLAAWGSVVVNCFTIHFLDYSGVHDRESFAKVASGSLLVTWIYRISYMLVLCLIKTSILLFYNYIAASHKNFHRLVKVLIAINFIGSASMIGAAIFSCYPIGDAWSFRVFELGFYGVHATQCYDPRPFWIFNASYNLVTDVVIWTIPILFLFNLRTMNKRRRLELVGIFSIGLFAIIGSAVRLRVIILWLTDWLHMGENAANLQIWSQVEQNVGIIAGSVPFIRPIFRKALHRVRSREQPSPGPVIQLIGAVHDQQNQPQFAPRALIIPSPSPTFGEFRMPKELPPIEPIRTQYSWGSGIWDGSQVRQDLPT